MSAPARLHGDGCACVRCTGFQPSHELSTKHSSYSNGIALSESAERHAEGIRSALPVQSSFDEGAVRLLAIVERRVERANEAVDRADDAQQNALSAYAPGEAALMLATLRADLRAWIRLARQLRADLGLTTASRARLGLDLALAERANEQALGRLGDTGRQIRERREDES